ncbi:MAG: hypothetical protein ABSH56_00265 [Bryobacteraceae bacterium]|jgi:hypothetical protein
MQTKYYVLVLTAAVTLTAASGDETAERLQRAATVLNTLTHAGGAIRPERIASADCIAVIPGFKKGAAVVGVGYGRDLFPAGMAAIGRRPEQSDWSPAASVFRSVVKTSIS